MQIVASDTVKKPDISASLTLDTAQHCQQTATFACSTSEIMAFSRAACVKQLLLFT